MSCYPSQTNKVDEESSSLSSQSPRIHNDPSKRGSWKVFLWLNLGTVKTSYVHVIRFGAVTKPVNRLE